MTSNRAADRVPRALVAAVGALAIAAFFLSCLQRLGSPTELGSGEGTLIDHAIRFAQGKPVFGPPTFEFIPLAYMPGMPLLASLLVRAFGPHLWEGRLIDLVAAAALCVMFVVAQRRETGSVALGLASAGIFVMGQGFTQGSYDVFRPDIVMLLLAFSGAFVLRFTEGTIGAVFSALLFALGFVFKQHGLVFGAVMLPYLFFADRRRLVPYTLALAVFAGLAFATLRLWLGPWFTFYVFDVPSHWSEISRARIEHYLATDVYGRFAMLTVPATLALGLRPWRDRAGLWWWLAVGGAGTGLMATLDPFAFFHTLIPGLCAFAFLGPLALHRISQALPAERRQAFAWAAAFVIAVQFTALPFSPRMLRPRANGEQTLREYTDFLRRQSRPVLSFHGFYSTAAGKPTGLSILPLDDVLRSRGNSLLRRDPHYFDRMFATLRRGPNRPIILADSTIDALGDQSEPYWASIAPGYRLAGTLGGLAARLQPVVGAHDTPRYIYVPVETDSVTRPTPMVVVPTASVVVPPTVAVPVSAALPLPR